MEWLVFLVLVVVLAIWLSRRRVGGRRLRWPVAIVVAFIGGLILFGILLALWGLLGWWLVPIVVVIGVLAVVGFTVGRLVAAILIVVVVIGLVLIFRGCGDPDPEGPTGGTNPPATVTPQPTATPDEDALDDRAIRTPTPDPASCGEGLQLDDLGECCEDERIIVIEGGSRCSEPGRVPLSSPNRTDEQGRRNIDPEVLGRTAGSGGDE